MAMNRRAGDLCRKLYICGAKQLAAAWVEPWPLPRAAMHGLDLPLLPSKLARHARRCFVACQLAYALELAWLGHWVAGAGVLAVAIACAWRLRRAGRQRGRQLRRLLVAADGRLHGLTASGDLPGLRLHPASLSLGRSLLLCLVGEGRTEVLILGPDNLTPASLAELRRRLRFPSTGDFD